MNDKEFIAVSVAEYAVLVAIKEQVTEALAMLHAPGFENSGGPANIVDEVRAILDNNNTLVEEIVALEDSIYL